MADARNKYPDQNEEKKIGKTLELALSYLAADDAPVIILVFQVKESGA
jgi:hypothetical protein